MHKILLLEIRIVKSSSLFVFVGTMHYDEVQLIIIVLNIGGG